MDESKTSSDETAEGYARGAIQLPAVSSVPADKVTLMGIRIYDGATGETFKDLVRSPETGEMVEAEPGQGIVGVTLNAGGGRWVTEDEVSGADAD